MPADAELLQRYADDHSEDAFAELVRRHLDGVYSAALRRVGGDSHLAQDVAQAVFVALARQSRGLVSHPFLTAWLYATTRNEAANTVRRERRRKTREAAASAMNETSASSSAEATAATDWSRLSPVLDDAIDQLSEPDRTAILLRFVDRRPFAEIGANLRLTEDAARMRVDRALDKLRTVLTRRGLTSTSAALGLILANNAVAAAPATVATSITLGAIGTIPATITAGAVASAKIGISTALSSKAFIGVTAIIAASLGYFVFESMGSKPLPPISTPSVATIASPKTPRAWPPEEAAVRAFLERHPEVQDALHRYYHARFKADFGHIYREMRLSREEISELQSLLSEGEIYSSIKSRSLKIPAGTGMSKPEAIAQMQLLLGTQRHAAWEKLRDDLYLPPVRRAVEKIASCLAFSSEQLTPSQTAQLAELLHPRHHRVSWDQRIEDARRFLSPRQLEAFMIVPAGHKYGEATREFFNQSLETSAAQKSETAAEKNRQHALYLENNAATLALWHAHEHASLASDYAAFYERTRLSQEQRLAFENILIQHRLSSRRGDVSAWPKPTAGGAVKSLLGDAVFRELQSFERVRLEYQKASDFAGHATWVSQSLTAGQADKLAQLIASSKRRNPPSRSYIDWKSIEERSGEFLSSEQQDLLKTTETSSRFALQLEDAIERAWEKDRLAGVQPLASTP